MGLSSAGHLLLDGYFLALGLMVIHSRDFGQRGGSR
jgi:hypothetical protein